MSEYKINYGDTVIEDGLFLRRQDKQHKSPISYKDGHGGFFDHLSTFAGKSTIRKETLSLLETARRNVFFANFLIQDEQITENLISAAKRLNGHVYVLTTLKDRDFEDVNAGGFDESDEGWNFQEHMVQIEKLTRNGIFVKARSDCHAKFMVVDDKFAIVTSANAASTCYGDTLQKNGSKRSANIENGILFTVPSEVARLANFFRAIWRSGYNYYMSPGSKVFESGTHTDDIIPVSCKEPITPAEEGQVLWTAPADLRILSKLTEMINSAARTVVISSWVIKGIDGHALVETLEAAAKRDVNIKIIVRGIYRSDHRQSCYYLKKTLGDSLTILGDYNNHSKAVVVDMTEAMVLTANLDSQHGLDAGIEIAFLSKKPVFIKAVSTFLDRLEECAELEFVCDPTQAQAGERYWARGKPITWKDIHIRFDKNYRITSQTLQKLLDALKTQLVKVATDKESDRRLMQLITNNLILDCTVNNAGQLTVLNIKADPWAASHARFGSFLPKSTITITAD